MRHFRRLRRAARSVHVLPGWLLAAPLALAIIVSSDVQARERGITVTHAELACVSCHTGDLDVASGLEAVPPSSELVAHEEDLCGACHEGAVAVSHPIGVFPTRSVPATFPLARDGTLTCSTCHDIHDRGRGLLRSAGSREDLCLACHDFFFFSEMVDGGRSVLGMGHLNASATPWSSVDPYSTRCMGCHVDSGTVSGDPTRPRMLVNFGGRTSNHPIGRDYQEAVIDGGYRPALSIAPEIIFPGGRVGCVSCHQGYSAEHGRPPDTSRDLCLECHDM